jgi:hypothetical protein
MEEQNIIDVLIEQLEKRGFKRIFLDAWLELSLKTKGIRYTQSEIATYLNMVARHL